MSTVGRESRSYRREIHAVQESAEGKASEEPQDLGTAIDKAIKKFGEELGGRELSVTDFIRLFEFRQQLTESESKEVLVHWQETWEDPASDQ